MTAVLTRTISRSTDRIARWTVAFSLTVFLGLTVSCSHTLTKEEEMKKQLLDPKNKDIATVNKYLNTFKEIQTYVGIGGGLYVTKGTYMADSSKENYLEIKVDTCVWLNQRPNDSALISSYCSYKLFKAMDPVDIFMFEGIRINLAPNKFEPNEISSTKNLNLKKYFYSMDSLKQVDYFVKVSEQLNNAFIENKQNEINIYYDTSYSHTSIHRLEKLDSVLKSMNGKSKITLFTRGFLKDDKEHNGEPYFHIIYYYLNNETNMFEHTIQFFCKPTGDKRIFSFNFA